MTIPANLTHTEVGAFLRAVGTEMMQNNVCFDAALDGLTDGFIVDDIASELSRFGGDYDHDAARIKARARELLALTGEEAINFNSMDTCPCANLTPSACGCCAAP